MHSFFMLCSLPKKRVIKVFEGLPNFLRAFREGLPDFQRKLMRVLLEGLV